MAPIGISEFSFGYSFLYEQTHANWHNLKAAPILPSLQQEQDQGWDAHLPTHATDFYYQFKIADHLQRSNAKYIRERIYNAPYYRIALHKNDFNLQHQRLREHAKLHPETYYVAPEFRTVSDFNTAFLQRRLTSSCRLIPVASCCDIIDDEQHYITFQTGNQSWIEHSDPKYHDKSVLGSEVEKFYRESKTHWRPVTKEFTSNLFKRTVRSTEIAIERESGHSKAAAAALMDFDPDRAEIAGTLIKTSQILSVIFGLTLVLIGTRDE